MRVGDTVMSGPTADIKPGNALPLRDIPTGTIVHNIELQIGRGGQLCRSAGVGAQLMAKDGDYATLRLPSSEMRMVHLDCRATVGQIGNVTHENITVGKAGRSRWKGKRPKVRGSAIDHHRRVSGINGDRPCRPRVVLLRRHPIATPTACVPRACRVVSPDGGRRDWRHGVLQEKDSQIVTERPVGHVGLGPRQQRLQGLLQVARGEHRGDVQKG